MHDVARAAGVSQPLVSIVFRGVPGASEETRAHVLAVAAELGYRRDERARLLRQGRSRLIGVTFGPDQPFHGQVLDGLYAAAAEQSYDLTLAAVTAHRAEGEAVEALLRDRCEAVVLLGPVLPESELAAVAATVPVVAVSRSLDHPAFDSVAIDDRLGAEQGLQHLADLGHRTVAWIDVPDEAGNPLRRVGFETACTTAGVTPVVVAGAASEAGGAAALDLVLADHPEVTGIIAFNDQCAAGVVGQARYRGRAVPDDLSVIGFDDSDQARLPYLQLTSLSQDPQALAHSAIGLALRRIDATGTVSARHQVLSTRLVVRSSTARPR